jgi:hypothetical protein
MLRVAIRVKMLHQLKTSATIRAINWLRLWSRVV